MEAAFLQFAQATGRARIDAGGQEELARRIREHHAPLVAAFANHVAALRDLALPLHEHGADVLFDGYAAGSI